MLTPHEHGSNPCEHFVNPYENLWIYYIEGTPEKEAFKTIVSGKEDMGSGDSGFVKHRSFIGNWEEDGFSFLFFSAPSDEIVQQILDHDKKLTLIDRYEMTGEAWHGERIESYTSGNLCISPPWKIPFVNKPDLKHILLDPGVVFGTGRHPTTEDCLGYIQYLCNNNSVETCSQSVSNYNHPVANVNHPVSTVLDIGTGTGLLAIAAAAFGCRQVVAVDFNLLAVKTAQNNIRLNSFEDKILAIQGRAEDFITLPADLVVANIHYDVMRHLLEMDNFFDHKWLILSGLLRSEVHRVLDKLKEKGGIVVETLSPDGVWNTILAKGR